MTDTNQLSSTAILKKAKLHIQRKKEFELYKKLDSSIKEFVTNSFPTREIVNFFKSELQLNIDAGILDDYIEEKGYKEKKKKKSNPVAEDNDNAQDVNNVNNSNEEDIKLVDTTYQEPQKQSENQSSDEPTFSSQYSGTKEEGAYRAS